MDSQSTFITVSELTNAIKNQLESRFAKLHIRGEMTNIKLHSSGHLYFDLKDREAKISAIMFRTQSQLLKRPPKEGDQVIVSGSLSVYPPHGKYQMVIRSLEYQGVGELLYQLELLKKKLQEQGWFDQEKKKPLPKFPRTIGVITSPTGAVIQDIIHILRRRFAGFHLILNPVRVQGPEAPLEIAAAISQFNRFSLADVLIVGRGGGSLEDLWAFNEEIVVRAIFESQIPVISAVGHETDVTLSDFAADVRAPTPSAAAELVSAEKRLHLDFLNRAEKNISFALSHHLKRYETLLTSYRKHPLFVSPYALLATPMLRLDDLKEKLEEKIRIEVLKKKYLLDARKREAAALKPTNQLNLCRTQLRQFKKRVNESNLALLTAKKQKLTEIRERLDSLNPKKVLKRGYAILFAEKEGSVIVSAQTLTPKQKLRALFSDGEAKLIVNHE